jgi:hypothetical protein
MTGAPSPRPLLAPRAPRCTDHGHQMHIARAHQLSDAAEEVLVHLNIGLTYHSDSVKDHCLSMAKSVLVVALGARA